MLSESRFVGRFDDAKAETLQRRRRCGLFAGVDSDTLFLSLPPPLLSLVALDCQELDVKRVNQ
jgi:hypothetical protein